MTIMPRPRHAPLFVALLFLCSVSTANALQLGELRSSATIGESFEGRVDVYLNPSERSADMQLVVSPDLTYLSDMQLSGLVGSMRAEFVTPEFDRPHIRLSSSQTINSAIVAFRLKVKTAGVDYSRNYQVIPQRPLQARSLAPVDNVRNTEQVSTASVGVTGNEYGPVGRGETLWSVAKRVAAPGTKQLGQLVDSIFAANPEAFINGNRNLLRQGVLLTIPGTVQSTADTSVAATPTSIETRPAESVELSAGLPVTRSDNEIEAAETTATTPAPVASRAPVVTAAEQPVQATVRQTRDPELAAELERLGRKYAALRARYGGGESLITEQTPVAESPAPAQLEAPIESAVPLQQRVESRSVASTALPPADLETATNDTTAEVQAESMDDAVSATTSGDRMVTEVASGGITLSVLMSWLAVALAIVLAAVVVLLVMKLRAAHQKRTAINQHNELEKERKAEVTKKAQQRLQMEHEVERMLTKRKPAGEAEQTIAVDVNDIDIGDDHESSDSNQSQIDMSIAHGRYEEAEKLLLDVIATSPRNFSAKLRLAEVFYITERIEQFIEIANDLHQNHRSDISDEDWRRVMRMGKMIAPDRPPFSGPRSVSEIGSS